MPRIALLIGTRPEAIKMAPVVAALQGAKRYEQVVINSGQHRELIDQVIDVFGIRVDHNLAVMQENQGLSLLLARLLEGIDKVLSAEKPDMVMAQGDTSTVLAAALAAFHRRIPFGHVEAGLRTRNLRSPFPEEANRLLVSRLAALHFAPTSSAADNLRQEDIPDKQIVVTGNTVVDALFMEVAHQRNSSVNKPLKNILQRQIGADFGSRPFVLITGHRRENFGNGFDQICDAIIDLARLYSGHLFIYPVHLNPNVREVVQRRLSAIDNIRLIAPQPYRHFVALLSECRLILTDSGGVQEEAPSLGKPVLIMRDTTERPEGIAAGTAKLVGTDTSMIVREVSRLLDDEAAYRAMAEAVNPFGDGKAAARIVAAIERFFDGVANGV